MSHFTHLSLIQFRNYTKATFDFKQRIIGIAGPNGSGKTNLLDAIYYLCFTRSYFARPDSKNAMHGTEGFRLEGRVEQASDFWGHVDTDKQPETSLVCVVRPGDKKEFLFNGAAYEKFSEHIGRFPAVMIAPDDSTLITGGSEERRKFIDTILSQTDPDYLQHLIHYNKILQQRNALLKSGQGATKTEGVLVVLDQQLCQVARPIYSMRKLFLESFIASVKEGYLAIAGKDEAVEINYDSQLHKEGLDALLLKSRERDFLIQRTSKGIHRDDLVILLGELPFKTLASQGQRKSLLFALKLASYYYIASRKKTPPILLLDDVFEKLDSQRMLNLLRQVADQLHGQVFITDTHCERLKASFEDLGQDYQLVELVPDSI